MDKISFDNLVVHAYHGVRPEEKTLGQKISISMECAFDTRAAARQDDFERTVCYAQLMEISHSTATEFKFDLLETLAHNIAMNVLRKFPMLDRVSVTASKIEPPVVHNVERVSVSVERNRADVR